MDADRTKQPLVRHPNRPDWGLGRVIARRSDGIVNVLFTKAGHKDLDLRSVSFSLIPIVPSDENVAAFETELLLEKLRQEDRRRHEEETRKREMAEALASRHQQYLAAVGRPDRGRVLSTRPRRTSHCFSCGTRVDNQFDTECAACGWIICPRCGACGCRYEG